MEAMDKFAGKTDWKEYAKAVDEFSQEKGCEPMNAGEDETYPHLPKRLGQIAKAYADCEIPCPAYPTRPKKVVDTNYETMQDIIRRRAAAKTDK